MSATVKLVEKPSDQLIAQAAQEILVTDSKGRAIKLRKPPVLAQYRIIEVVGADAAPNSVYMAMVMPLIFVTEIEGEPSAQPRTKAELEALIQRLDEHGLDAVMKGVNEHWGQQNPQADKAAIKK